MAVVSQAIHVLQCVHQYRSVFTISIPTRFAVSAEGARRTSQHGHHHRRIPFVDVARTWFFVALSVHRLFLSSVQCVVIVQIELASGRHVASVGVVTAVSGVVRRQHNDNVAGDTAKDSRTCQGTVSIDERIQIVIDTRSGNI